MGSTNLRGEESQGEHQGDQFPGQKPQAQISVIFKEHLGGSTQRDAVFIRINKPATTVIFCKSCFSSKSYF